MRFATPTYRFHLSLALAACILMSAGTVEAQQKNASTAFRAVGTVQSATGDQVVLRHFDPSEEQFVWATSAGGWVHGTNGYDDRAKSVAFQLPGGMESATLEAVNVYFGYKSETHFLQFYEIQILTGDLENGPANVIYSEEYGVWKINADDDVTTPETATAHVFAQPVTVPSLFYVSVDLGPVGSYDENDLAIVSSDDIEMRNPFDWEMWDDGTWHNISDAWGFDGSYMWIEAVLDAKGVSNEAGTELAATAVLEQNYPNPFNPTTSITFRLDAAGMTSLRVYDVLGREVAVLLNERMPAGEFQATFDAAALPSGTYVYVLEQNGQRKSSMMTLLK
jgi:hypothetical protein